MATFVDGVLKEATKPGKCLSKSQQESLSAMQKRYADVLEHNDACPLPPLPFMVVQSLAQGEAVTLAEVDGFVVRATPLKAAYV